MSLTKCLSLSLLCASLAACGGGGSSGGASEFDPLAVAQARGLRLDNKDAQVPPQCYTKTDGISNPCWVCHTQTNGLNVSNDESLQESYAFSESGQTNHWTNLFVDRSAKTAAISDAAALAYIRQDNYTPLMASLKTSPDYFGWRPDLDYAQGFDADGFARDGTWWRAFRYKPFLGTFWPTNGSTDDVIIRLAPPFYTGVDGKPSREIYKINLAILEAVIAVADTVADTGVARSVEPVSENLAGMDLNGDGVTGGSVAVIHGLPAHYVTYDSSGHATDVPVVRWQYPQGTEFLHTVRYLDPDVPTLLSTRMKEVRYAIKLQMLSTTARNNAYAEQANEDAMGLSPFYPGTPPFGLHNDFGWRLNAFIEDEKGRLRLQTYEEHYFCMGCHTGLGVTVDQSFSFPRKPPGAAGWGHQALIGMQDVAQAGQADPEILTYFKRVGAGDEFRANTEVLSRFFPGGTVDETSVRRAAPGGDMDISYLVAPSRARALALDKAYMALVGEQKFDLGRAAVLSPPQNVHQHIDNGDTGLGAGIGVFGDGRLWLQWPEP
jgi:hypothetical protein